MQRKSGIVLALNQSKWTLFAVVSMTLLVSSGVEAGFWTFYFPNFLKPSGYKELTEMITNTEKEINSTRDAFSDAQYFWGLLQEVENADPSLNYPEDSACSEVFPLFRDLAIEYTYIDFEHYLSPFEEYLELLKRNRKLWYPDGRASRTILPREWEQNLYEQELVIRLKWQEKLVVSEEYKEKRDRLVNTWKNVKRSLDGSLPCIYLRFAYRQIAEDINQLALEFNIISMMSALNLVRNTYKRIALFKQADVEAVEKIQEAVEMNERLKIRL